ncbi:hypothetical protein WJX74_001714 [Apatococcus lobatus]|uniref:D-isomer specific 2-hydroxyacid dehydrogenase NAD-binding domain-containing protein n=1 Tax=Apatococcus lobatus TaxID=904363 RepID=A0AAW1RS90_9CHLO
MMILALVRNYMTAHYQVINGKWQVADIAKDSWDVENKVIGTIGAGRIGQRVLERLIAFKPSKLLYSDYAQLPKAREQELQAEYVSMEDLVKQCDVITINCPLHKETEGMFNKRLFDMMKPRGFLVNTARGKIVDREAVKEALESGHLQGYAGDVWYPQPAPEDHPWRHMPRQAMTPHYSGTTLDAQQRYAAGTKEVLRRFFSKEELNPTDVIVSGGKMAAQYDSSVNAEGRSLEFKEEWEKINKPSGPASGAAS